MPGGKRGLLAIVFGGALCALILSVGAKRKKGMAAPDDDGGIEVSMELPAEVAIEA